MVSGRDAALIAQLEDQIAQIDGALARSSRPRRWMHSFSCGSNR